MDFLKECVFDVDEACDYRVNGATVLSILREHATNDAEEYYDVELPVELDSLGILIPWLKPIEVRHSIRKLQATGKIAITNEARQCLRVLKARRPLLVANTEKYKAVMQWAMAFEMNAYSKLTLISLVHHAFDDLALNERMVEAAMDSSEINEPHFAKSITYLRELGLIEIEIFNEDTDIRLCFDMGGDE